MKSLVAIVGRPNTGKSTFFNRVVGKRISIVDDMPGVTRDRLYADVEWCGQAFTLIDTGGVQFDKTDNFTVHINKQVDIAIDLADLILFFVDGKEGLVPTDFEVAEKLRKSGKKVLLVANKYDTFKTDNIYDFYELGMGEPIPISGEQAKGIGDLLDEVVKNLDHTQGEEESDVLKIAIVGKPNTGKSSIINRLVGEDRVIVSNVSGTTRDSVDVPFNYNKKKYLLIDTAGMRRKRSIEDETVERYSIFRTLDSIRRADVVVVVMDVAEEISEQDVKIAGLVHEQQKPSIIVFNKWDKIEKETSTMNTYENKLKNELDFMRYFKPVFLSALTGKRMEKLMQAVEEVYANNTKRIKTSDVNDIIQDAVISNAPPVVNGKRLKIYYATQSGVTPPTF
ncbi:MAG: ribosome biogenesis GTPase Der, partial [Clostridia bacterium]|nr:ribosome biogenesis GTPase Der [Clostridia bacterium]